MRFKIDLIYLFFFCWLCIFCACQSDTIQKNLVKSKIVSIQYDRYGRVPDSAWIKIDNLTFIHSKYDFEYNSSEINNNENEKGYYTYIPSSEVLMSHPTEEKKMRSDRSTNVMISEIARVMIKSPELEGVYELLEPEKFVISEELILRRKDGKRINVSTSANNIVNLRVVQN